MTGCMLVAPALVLLGLFVVAQQLGFALIRTGERLARGGARWTTRFALGALLLAALACVRC